MLLPTQIWNVLGHLHPLVIHFPIGLLIVAMGMEMFTLNGKRENLQEGIRWMVYIGAAAAVLAAILGLLLRNGGNYAEDWVDFHQTTGILTALQALLTAYLLWRIAPNESRKLYRMSLFLTVGTLTVAGHFGAGLTHGKDYLGLQTVPPKGDTDQAASLSAFTAQTAGAPLSESDKAQLNLQVRAIFAHHCYKCHSTEKQKGGLILQDSAGVMRGGDSGPILIPGDAANSEIIRRLKLPRSHEEAMPPKGKLLEPAEIEWIRLWVEEGAPWADENAQIFREAPLALSPPTLPPNSAHFPNAIDQWVDDYFQHKDLSWPERVNDRLYLRRIYLDVVGLLPTPEEISAFEQDKDPQKREKRVRMLLDNTHGYAQHWLSFWNDLLRNDYSGTGFITGGRKQISHWLYESLQHNKPYDQMVRELLYPQPESEGFIRGIKWRGTVNASQRTEMQAAQNISQSLLGVNLKCASCHDSFVSNLTLDEAYAFANIFADTTLEIHRCDKPTGKMARTGFLYPELGEVNGDSLAERLEQLAQAVVQPENGRLYRTVVNRLWARLMGRGIVSPLDEMDRLPWSQELLDWLAADLIAHNYDLKHTLYTLMTSHTYQLPSIPYESTLAVRKQDFVFQGPLRRRMTAEQFTDVLSQVYAPVYASLDFDPLGGDMPAAWIWHREREVDRDVLPKPGKRYFRKVWEESYPQDLQVAECIVSVDHSFTLYLNGKKLTEGADWRQVKRVHIKEYLRPGINVIAIEGENEGKIPNPAGILLSMRWVDSAGNEAFLYSDNTWKSTDNAPDTEFWTTADFDDSHWNNVKSYGRFRKSHWGRLLDFTHTPSPDSLKFARASLVKLDPFQKALGRPTRENVATFREDQATLLQALELTNGAFFNEILVRAREAWIGQVGEDADALVEEIYLHSLGRNAHPKEKKVALQRIKEVGLEAGVEDVLWSLAMLPEFQLIY